MTKRDFDIVVWGATGFTGALAAEYILGRYGSRGAVGGTTRFSVALAGRSREKLEAARSALEVFDDDIGLIVADAGDQSSVDDMVRRASVVVAAVGPFTLYGTPVVDACVRLGTDYCDITGEASWTRAMIDRYHEDAERKKVAIVSMAGFDSVPADLTTLMLHRFATETAGSPLATVDAYAKVAGGMSGGTAQSILTLMKQPGTMKAMSDPFLLNPRDRRPAAASPHDRDVVLPGRDPTGGGYTIPFLMAGVNTKVVRRSAALVGYGDAFSYNERMSIGSLPVAFLSYVGLALFALALAVPPLRYLLERFVLPKSGEGPSAEQRAKGRFTYTVAATTVANHKLRAVMSGGDPGYGETAKMLGETAACLVLRASHGPCGVITPATAVGDHLIERLRAADMTLTVGFEE